MVACDVQHRVGLTAAHIAMLLNKYIIIAIAIVVEADDTVGVAVAVLVIIIVVMMPLEEQIWS